MAALMLSSCEDFLDTNDPTKANSSNFPQTKEQAEMILAGVYNGLNRISAIVRVADGESVSPSCCVAKFMTVGTFIPFANPWWGPAKSFSNLMLFHASKDKLIFTFNDGNIWCWVFEAK